MSGYGQIDEWARQIGFKVVRFVPILDHGGWASVAGARTYLHHGGDIPTAIFLDFVDVALGGTDAPAAERLRGIAPEWGCDVPSLQTPAA